MLHGILHLLQAEKEKEMINKKTWHTPVQLLISAAGILILSWIDLNAVAIHYNETINEFVAEYDTTGFAILNVVLCLFTSYFLARLLSWSKSTWSLMFVIYTLMLCAFVPKLIAINSAVYLSLHFMSSARLFGSVLAVRTVIIVIAFILLLLLSLSSIVSGFAEKIKRLAQENALLEERVRRLEAQLAAQDKQTENEKTS